MKRARKCVPAAILLAGAMAAGCRPQSPPPALISDGTVVVVRSGITNAAFLVSRQHASPETVDYTWFLRSDGKPTFDAKDPGVATGTVTGATGVAFGPFNIQWSSAGSTGGYVYYPSQYWWIKLPWGGYLAIKNPRGPLMAVTTERDPAKVNARDPRWKYRR